MAFARGATLALLALGAALRLWQYLGDASLWLDELAVALNVIHRPLGRLLSEPLAYDQLAPPGFLLVEKCLSSILGPSEFVLRLFPLVCSLVSLPLFLRVARGCLTEWGAILALAIFSCGGALISYGSEVKQYSSDVMASLLLTWLGVEACKAALTWRRCLLGALGASLLVWFSHPAVFVLGGLGTVLVMLTLAQRDRVSPALLLALLSVSAASGALAVWHARETVTPETHAYLVEYFTEGFMPGGSGILTWTWHRLVESWGALGLGVRAPRLAAGFMLLGYVLLLRGRPLIGTLLIVPTVAVIAAAGLKAYPFQGRTIGFLLPGFAIAMAEGVDGVRRAVARHSQVSARAAGVIFLLPLAGVGGRIQVQRPEEAQPALAYLVSRYQPGDAIYVYYAADKAFLFYASQSRLQLRDALVGGCHRGDNRAYLREIDQFRGRRRVWVFFSHALEMLGEEAVMVKYLNEIGRQLDQNPASLALGAPTTAVLLYDLSDVGRLRTTSADRMEVPVSMSVESKWSCSHGPHVPRGIP